MFLRALVIAILTSICAVPLVAADPIDSIYTDLSSAHCRTTKVVEEAQLAVNKCAGVVGHRLLVETSDARDSVTVLTPDGKQHPLNYLQFGSGAFSSVAEKAEWRVARKGGKVVPIALIVRVVYDAGDGVKVKKVSQLAVAKITAENICVTDWVKGGVRGNEAARREADVAAEKPCLKAFRYPD